MYFADSKPLTREEERRCLILAKRGNKQARERLIKSNMRYVHKVAFPYWKRHGGELEDYIQEGVMGLVRALDKYELERELRLISYGTHWIKAYVCNYVMKLSMVKWATTQNMRSLFFKYPAAVAAMTREGVDYSDEEAAKRCDVRVDEIQRFREAYQTHVSLDAPVGDDGEMTFVDMLADTRPTADDVAEVNQEKRLEEQRVHKALARLDGRERWIVEQRIMSDKPPTLREVGDRFGISRERARQLEIRAREKLKRAFHDLDNPPEPQLHEAETEKAPRKRRGRPPKQFALPPPPAPMYVAPAPVEVKAVEIPKVSHLTPIGKKLVDLSPSQKMAWQLKEAKWNVTSIAAIMGVTTAYVYQLLKIARWKIEHPPMAVNG